MTLSQLRSYDHIRPPKSTRSSGGSVDLNDRLVQRTLSRRRLLKAAAGLSTGAMIAGGLGLTASAQTEGSDPQPIPGGIEVGGVQFHVYLPVPDVEPSSIGSFNGIIGLSEMVGMGTTNDGQRLPFVADQRFMTGEYVGLDGERYRGSFGFI